MTARERTRLRCAIDARAREIVQNGPGHRPRPDGDDPLAPPVPGDWMPHGVVPDWLRGHARPRKIAKPW